MAKQVAYGEATVRDRGRRTGEPGHRDLSPASSRGRPPPDPYRVPPPGPGRASSAVAPRPRPSPSASPAGGVGPRPRLPLAPSSRPGCARCRARSTPCSWATRSRRSTRRAARFAPMVAPAVRRLLRRPRRPASGRRRRARSTSCCRFPRPPRPGGLTARRASRGSASRLRRADSRRPRWLPGLARPRRGRGRATCDPTRRAFAVPRSARTDAARPARVCCSTTPT